MITAYDELYLEKARIAFGRMLDYAVNDQIFTLESFFERFLLSPVSHRLENGEPSVLVGHSGVELCYMVLDSTTCPYQRVQPSFSESRSPEYWTGWRASSTATRRACSRKSRLESSLDKSPPTYNNRKSKAKTLK